MPRTIKRYGNRKLYDTEHKRYIRLDEIAELIRKGEDIAVIDKDSGADVTAQTLAKIIAEADEGRLPVPGDLLRHWIRRGTDSAQSGLREIKGRVDRAVTKSIEATAPLRALQDEVARLRARILDLESTVAALQREVDDDHDSGRSNSGPAGSDG